MTQQEGVAFLEEMQISAKQYVDMLERCIGGAKGVSNEEVASVTQQV